MSIDPRVIEDLKASNLVPEDMTIRMAGGPEKASTSTAHSTLAYVIPYYDLYGKPVQFYRLRLFDSELKYMQPKDNPNHVYFPKGFIECSKKLPYIIMTEGEKKAACLVKAGIPCVAFGGVDAWRNRIFTLPKDVEMSTSEAVVRVKIPPQTGIEEDFGSPLAIGMSEFVDYALQHHKTLIVIYDTDNSDGTSMPVQRAAATLGYELRFRGVPFNKIRQLVLPWIPAVFGPKTGLDDFLVGAPPGSLEALIVACLKKPSAFPRHPNVRDYLNKRLQRSRLSRKEMQSISLAVLTELDAGGMRLRSVAEQQTFYFERSTHKLLKVTLAGDPNKLADSTFGQYMYHKFGLGGPDQRVIQWISTQFTGEDPVLDVSPHRVFARPDFKSDVCIYQLTDGDYARVTGGSKESEEGCPGLEILPNGTDNILFEAGHVQGINIPKLKAEYAKLVAQYEDNPELPLQSYWMEVLSDVRLKDKDRQRVITAMLFYLSPWLYRWRGMQLPIEMTIGEAGSGKSSLQELRLNIQTGNPKLRNAPTDIKDWHASISNAGGLHVVDNLALADKALRQRLSDEICRIITEPNPTIEMRTYYTNAELMQIPIRCVFSVTAIQQPFLNADILQRSVMIELDKAQDLKDGKLSYDSTWMSQQLNRYGGREAWQAHQLYVLHRFFQLVERKWNHRYKALHRLINFEQAMLLMAELFGIPSSWIPQYLSNVTQEAVVDADWAFEGLMVFSQQWGDAERMGNKGIKYFTSQDISNWAIAMPEFEKCEVLTNSRKLGKYLATHKTMAASHANIVHDGSMNNRQRYRVMRQNDGRPSNKA